MLERTSELMFRVPAQADRDSHRGDAAPPVQLRVRRVYAPGERPRVLVLVHGQWHQGELRKWSQDPAGAWWGSVAWGRRPGSRFLDTFAAERVWADEDGAPPPS